MERLLSIVAGAALVLMFSAMMLVVAPYLQIEAMGPSEGLKPYSEQAQRGRDLYVELGCMYCHTQQPRDPSFGPDNLRGWGRPSVPGDYYYDSPHQLGTMRTGPDLMNIGVRQPSDDWHLIHLYQPRAVVPGSIMPGYPFLFATSDVKVSGFREVPVSDEFKEPGRTVYALQPALDLVAYLKEMKRDYPVSVLEPKEEQL